MNTTPDKSRAAPRVAILLPVAYLLHLAEEWFGDLPAWTRLAPGPEVSPERFLLINAVAFLLFLSGTVAALRYPRMAWFAAAFAALLGLNGVVHALATLGLGSYSPGTVTGLLIYLPLSVIVLRSSAARLSRAMLVGSVILGVLLHAIAYLVARY
jgi:hypothetical protein